MAADEETPLTNSNNGEEKSTPLGEYLKLEVNLETIRLIGLMGIGTYLLPTNFCESSSRRHMAFSLTTSFSSILFFHSSSVGYRKVCN